MIGQLTLPDGRVATMDDDGTWQSGDELLAQYLGARFAVRGYSPADGVFGLRQLHAAAEKLSGTVAGVREPAPEEEGAEPKVY